MSAEANTPRVFLRPPKARLRAILCLFPSEPQRFRKRTASLRIPVNVTSTPQNGVDVVCAAPVLRQKQELGSAESGDDFLEGLYERISFTGMMTNSKASASGGRTIATYSTFVPIYRHLSRFCNKSLKPASVVDFRRIMYNHGARDVIPESSRKPPLFGGSARDSSALRVLSSLSLPPAGQPVSLHWQSDDKT